MKEHAMTTVATPLETKLAAVLRLEFTAAQSKNCLPLAMNVAQAAIGAKADLSRFYAAINGLTDEELKAYAAHRRVNKWWNFR
jgi:hypothetical protein